MATIKTQLEADLKTAMKAGDTTARETIRFTLAAIKNMEIEKREPLTDAEELDVLKVQAKRRVDSIEQFQKAGRDDLAQRETDQMAVLKKYMPVELSDEDLTALVAGIVAEVGATGPQSMGKVMPLAIKAAGDSVSGKRLSDAVRQALAALGG